MAYAQQEHHVTGWTGWVVFASVLMGLVGALHILYGLAGIFSANWYLYASGHTYVFNSDAWGWSMFAGGILLVISSVLLAMGNLFGRIIGGTLAVLGILANLALITIAPFWSIVAIVVNAMVLYAIVTHGRELKRETY